MDVDEVSKGYCVGFTMLILFVQSKGEKKETERRRLRLYINHARSLRHDERSIAVYLSHSKREWTMLQDAFILPTCSDLLCLSLMLGLRRATVIKEC